MNPPLEDGFALGAVTSRSARLWLRSGRPGRVFVRCWPEHAEERALEVATDLPTGDERDRTHVLELPGSRRAGRLAPRTLYRFRIRHEEGHELGAGRFETAPSGAGDAPDDFSIGFLSCHQPFDRAGAPTAEAISMLRAARAALEEADAKLVLLMGDQMYTDHPKRLSLFDEAYFRRVAPSGRSRLQDCSPQEVRRLLHARYRHFWSVPGWMELQARFPCLPILDDHEIVDNWGSALEHRQEPWRSVGEGARLAYLDYQGSRVREYGEALPDDFDHAIDYGDVSLYVLDLRSSRRVGEGARVVSPDQLRRLEAFLAERGSQSAIFVVLSVPLVHLPRWAARGIASVTPSGEDFSDRWSTAGHRGDRDRILELLHAHQQRFPEQRLVLLSGDIHIACAHEIAWSSGARPLLQAVSSGITHAVSRPVALASSLSIGANRHVGTGRVRARVRRLAGEAGLDRNPFGRLNLGVVRCRRVPGRRGRELRILVYTHEREAPRLVYRSRPCG